MDIGLHCFYKVSGFGMFAGEGFQERSHHSDISLWLWDLLWSCSWSLRGRGLSSSSSTAAWVSSRVSSTGVPLHAFIPGMFDALALIVHSSCGGGLYCCGQGHHCLRHHCIFEWYMQRWRCMNWALSDCVAVFLFLFIEVVVCVRLVFA